MRKWPMTFWGIFTICLLFTGDLSAQNRWLSFSGAQSRSASSSGVNLKPIMEFLDNGDAGVEVRYSFPGAQVSDLSEGGILYQFLHIDQFGKLNNPGKPALPARYYSIVVPAGKKASVRIINSEAVTFKGYNVPPALEPASDKIGAKEPVFEYDTAFYSSNVIYPDSPVEIAGTKIYRGKKIVQIQVCPVQFNPAQKELLVHSQLNFYIDFIDDKSESATPIEDESAVGQAVLQNIAINTPLSEFSDAAGIYPEIRGGLLIVTVDEYLESADSLAAWKRLMGYDVEVVSKASWASYDEVKDTVDSKYGDGTLGLEFCLVLGDHEDVPSYFSTLGSYSHVTDLYLGCMDGAGDIMPDIALGRITATSAAEASAIVAKIVNYERNPVEQTSFYTNAISAAYFQHAGSGYAERRFAQTSWEISQYLQNEYLYNVDLEFYTESSVYPTNWNNGYYSSGEAIPTELQKPNFAWDGNAAGISDAVNAGSFMLFHRDHGAYYGWGDPAYGISDITSLTNGDLLPVVFSINCQTGQFNNNTQSFAEEFLEKADGGAVGVIAATEISYSGQNDGFAEGLIDAVWPNPGLVPLFPHNPTPVVTSHVPIYAMGLVLNQGKLRMSETWNSGSSPFNYEQYSYELFHYLGDPSMHMWTAIPQEMAMDHASALMIGQPTIEIANANCLTAVVTVEFNGEIVGKAHLVDGNGTITLESPIIEVGNITLTATGHDFRPYQVTIPVIPAGDALFITSPSAGTVFDIDDSITINWSTFGTIPDVKVEFSSDNGFSYSDVVLSTINNNTYTFDAPDVSSDSCMVRVSDIDGDPVAVSGLFSIQELSTISGNISGGLSGEIYYTGPMSGNTIVDTAGAFTVERLLPGDYSFIAISGEFQSDTISVTLPGDTIIVFDIQYPEITLAPQYFSSSVAYGDSITDTLKIINSGESVLTWSLDYDLDCNETSDVKPAEEIYEGYHFIAPDKGEYDNRTGVDVTEGYGGPDNFGYKWIDSDEVGGPQYVWDDISSTGELLSSISGCDDCYESHAISFSFPFYDKEFDTIYVSSNGYITLGAGSSGYSTYPIPSTSLPQNLIAGFYRDLNPGSGGSVYFQDFGDRVVVQFNNVYQYSTTSPYTYQMVLYKNGKIRYYYHEMNGTLTAATVGIQDSSRTDGLNVVYNASYIHDSLAVEISAAPHWLEVLNSSGTTAAGDTTSIVMNFRSAELLGGNHCANVLVTHNSPGQTSPIIMPCTLAVDGIRRLSSDVDSIDFGTAWIGNTAYYNIKLFNNGNEETVINSIVSNSSFFGSDFIDSILIAPGDSRVINIWYAPGAVGSVAGELLILSNAEDNDTIKINLQGAAVEGPAVSYISPSLSVLLNSGESTNRLVTFINDGGDNLILDFNTGSQNWLSTDTSSSIVTPGDSFSLAINFNAVGAIVGDYQGQIIVHTNVPGSDSLIVLPCSLAVSGVKSLMSSDTTINFGTLVLSEISDSSVTLINNGADTTTVSEISFSDSVFSTTIIVPFTIAPFSEVIVPVSFEALAVGSFNSSMVVASDADDNTNILISLNAQVLNGPKLALSTSAISDTIDAGDSSVSTIMLSNSGDIELMFTINTIANYNASDAADTIRFVMDQSHGQSATLSTISNLVSDLEAKNVVVSINTATITDSVLENIDVLWLDDTPTSDFSDDEKAALDAWLRAGGSIMMQSDQPGAMDSLMVPYGIGFVLTSNGSTYYSTMIEEHEATIGVDSVYIISPYSILVPDSGVITLVSEPDGDPHICISEVGKGRIAVIANEDFHNTNINNSDNRVLANGIFDWLASTEKAADWLNVNMESGTIAPGDSMFVNVTMGRAELLAGVYSGALEINTNALGSDSLAVVTCNLIVEGNRSLQLLDDSLSVSTLVGDTGALSIVLYNNGMDSVIIDSIVIEGDGFYSNSILPVTITPGDTLYIPVEITSLVSGFYYGSVAIYSNVDSGEVFYVNTSAEFRNGAAVIINPNFINTTITNGDSAEVEITISNSGDMDLSYLIYSLPSWMSVPESTNIVSAGDTDSVRLLINSVSLLDSTYIDNFIISTNVIGTDSLIVFPCTLTVENMMLPSIVSQPLSVTAEVGDSVTFTISAAGPGLEYQWQRNGTNIDSAFESILIIDPVSANLNGSFYNCIVSNIYGSVVSDTAYLTVNVNHAPVGVDDSIIMQEDSVLYGASVLSNDFDPDGDSLNVVLISGVSNGSLSIDTNGYFSYSPSRNFNGVDFFTYIAIDPEGESSDTTSVTLTVLPVNDAPVINNVTSQTIYENGTLNVDFSIISASDVDGDTLSIIVDNGLHYTVDGNIISVDTGFTGNLEIIIRVSDGTVLSNSDTLSVTVVPVNNPVIDASVVEHQGTGCDYPEWQSDIIYHGGDTVSYNGRIYRARYWTQGNRPDLSGEWGHWQNVGECTGSGVEYYGTVTPEGNVEVNWDSSQVFTFIPDDGYGVVEVIIDGNPILPVPTASYTFNNVREDHTISVEFGIVEMVTLSISTVGLGSITGAGDLPAGSETAISATASTGYSFVRWEVLSGNAVLSDSTLANTTVIVSSDAQVRAVFEAVTWNISVIPQDTVAGTTSGSGTYQEGSVVDISTTVNTGYRFVNWTSNTGNVIFEDSTSISTTITVNGEDVITALYEIVPTYPVIGSSGANGVITPSDTSWVSEGDSIAFTATPNSGYAVDSVSINGIIYGANVLPYMFRDIQSAQSIHVTFREVPTRELTLLANNSSYGTVIGSGIYEYMSIVNVEAIANDGYRFVQWAGARMMPDSFSAIAEVHMYYDDTITAVFEAIPTYTVTAIADSHGVISPSGDISVNEGDSLIFEITADDGYEIADVLVDGLSVGVVSQYEMTGITSDRTITATFVEISGSICDGISEWDANTPWYNYTVGDQRVNNGALYECTNIAYSYFEPSGLNGGYGWTFIANCE